MAGRTSRIQGFGNKGTNASPTKTLATLVVSELFGATDRGEQRAQFVVSNLADPATSSDYLTVLSTDGKEVMPVWPGQQVTIETDGEFRLFNGSTNTVAYMVGIVTLRGVTEPVGGNGSRGAGFGGGGGGGGDGFARGDYAPPGRHLA